MSNTKYQRDTYTPAVQVVDKTSFRPLLLLDSLNSKFLDLQEQIVDYRFHTITSLDDGMPDYASFKFYGTEKLWWIICIYNGIINPLSEYRTGVTVKIPKIDNDTVFLTATQDLLTVSSIGNTRSL